MTKTVKRYLSQFKDSYPIVGFDQQLSSGLTDEIFCEITRLHLDQLSSAGWDAGGQFIADCIGSNCLLPLYVYDPDCSDLSASDRYHLTQCLSFFKKRTDVDIGIDRDRAAFEKFIEAEEQCALTNRVFLAHSQGRFEFHPDIASVLYRAQQKICVFLEKAFPCGAPTFDEIRPRFGPGSTTQTRKQDACVPTKLAKVPACAANTVSKVNLMLESTGWAEDRLLSIPVMESLQRFVNKSAKTKRGMRIDPTVNSMYQLGLGDLLSKALRLLGLDIRDQSANKRAALYGSIHGLTATVDLSSASDTIAWRLVEYLFPREWFDLFWLLSSRQVALEDGTIMDLELMSSMGNGFTFPLETLIFWALSDASREYSNKLGMRRLPRTLVYGDDIIVPTSSIPVLVRVFQAVGLTVNMTKSFWSGRFRESCGGDYVDGIDIRPFSLSADPDEHTQDTDFVEGRQLFALHNYYVRRGFHYMAAVVESYLHPSIRTRGPDGYGDGHLVGVYLPTVRHGAAKSCGFTFNTWGFSPRQLRSEIFSRLADHVPKERRRSRTLIQPKSCEIPPNPHVDSVPCQCEKVVVMRGTQTRRTLASGKSYDCLITLDVYRHPCNCLACSPPKVDIGIQTGYKDVGGSMIEFIGPRFRLAVRVATYVTYLREETYDRLQYLEGTKRADTDIWITPGRGPVRRMSIRTFEPVYAMN